ncbi:MAG TPA: disulfide bond formation protein B [Ilumatobacter sp.]|nr:disulfide bond formation protein B [Ilumatobacter sp.]
MLAALVEPETMQVLTALLALAAAGLAVAVVAVRLLAARLPVAARLNRLVGAYRNAVTLAVAGAATLGSLYFSEVAHYVPCRLCWFQRVAMYPIAVLALVAVLRRDRGARWYAVALAAIGAPISGYHYLIEWKPGLDSGSCSLFGPACTDIWFRTFGFATLAFMALCGFVAILAVNLLPPDPEAS